MRKFFEKFARILGAHVSANWGPSVEQVLKIRARHSSADFVTEFAQMALLFTGPEAIRNYAVQQLRLEPRNDEFISVLEFGVYKGRSARFWSRRLPKGHRLVGFDSFEGLSHSWYGTYMPKGHFSLAGKPPRAPRNTSFVRGWVETTLPQFLESQDISNVRLVHMDLDIYEPSVFVLSLLSKHLRPGCYILFDEYFSFPGWQNCEHRALTESGIRHEFVAIASNPRGSDQALVKIV